MIRVRNGKTLRRISRKILKASGGRNIIAMTAIAMTAMLFTAMLTMGGSVLETVQQDTFRQVGGDFHGGFKRLTEDNLNIFQIFNLTAPVVEQTNEKALKKLKNKFFTPFNA